ncbi:MAG: hypothetical protein OIF54_07080 [Cohaesibacter sp.]|nr:hypothetical protein [Cohaesibacter sp.]
MKLLIQLDTDELQYMDRVAENLSSLGLDIDRKMDVLGVITGDAPQEQIPALRSVHGVKSLRADETVTVWPPRAF